MLIININTPWLYIFEISGKSPGPVESSKHDFIRLSFKDGYDSTFTTKLSTVVLNRRWETVPISTSLPGAPPPVQVYKNKI